MNVEIHLPFLLYRKIQYSKNQIVKKEVGMRISFQAAQTEQNTEHYKVENREATCTTDGQREHWSCHVCEKMFSDDIKGISKLEKEITAKLQSALGLGVKVHLVNPKSIARSEGKAKRVVDLRKL